MKLPPWSFTMLDTFASCPKKAFHRYILKEKEPESEAQRKGNEFDKAVEARIRNGTPLPLEYAVIEPLTASLTRSVGKKYTQLKIGINRDFKPVTFFADDVWGRGVLDFALTDYPNMVIADWKTGKNNEGKEWYTPLQLKIFALLAFKGFPKVNKITAFNIYTQEGKPGKIMSFTRGDELTLWREVLPRVMAVEKAFKEQEWPACQGPLCQFCPVVTCNHNPKGGNFNAAQKGKF